MKTPDDNMKIYNISKNINGLILNINLKCNSEIISFIINEQKSNLNYEKKYSKNELEEKNDFFCLFDNIYQIFDKFKDLFINNNFLIEKKEEELILKTNVILSEIKLNIPLKLKKEENEIIKQLREENKELKKKILELEKKIEIKKNKKNNYPKLIPFKNSILLIFNISLTIILLTTMIKNIKNSNQTLIALSEKIEKIELNSFESTIIENNEEKDLISKWINMKSKIKYKLLFRASQDGDSIQKFHEKCDNKGPTLTIIKSKNGKRFGGYNPVNWDSSYNYNSHPNTFLFSLDTKKKYNLIDNFIHYASVSGKYYFAFGSGHDLYISDQCTKNKNSYSNTPNSFNTKELYELTGEKYFQVIDYEVFGIEFL